MRECGRVEMRECGNVGVRECKNEGVSELGEFTRPLPHS